jgi:hypothetical protein
VAAFSIKQAACSSEISSKDLSGNVLPLSRERRFSLGGMSQPAERRSEA